LSFCAPLALANLGKLHCRDLEIAAQTIKGEVLSGLVKAGLARKVVENVGRGVLTTEVTRGWEITPAGREALGAA